MMRRLFLFDVDNTLACSGQTVSPEMSSALEGFKKRYPDAVFGIVGGGTYDKIVYQLGETKLPFRHIFSECGCVHHKDGVMRRVRDIRRDAPDARIHIDGLVKEAMAILAHTPYPLGGHMIDVRTGLVYISCVGMTATASERALFLERHVVFRDHLLQHLRKSASGKDIEVKKGGSVGIAIYPKGWDKSQVLGADTIDPSSFDAIWYFGDSHGTDGNDDSGL